jgi:hypothetical protein
LPTQDNIGRPFASVMLTVVCFGGATVSAAGVGFVARAFLPPADFGAAGFFALSAGAAVAFFVLFLLVADMTI